MNLPASNSLPALRAALLRTLDREAGRVASGALSPQDFGEQAGRLLQDAHARAAVLGSARAGGLNLDAAIRAAAQADQTAFLRGFVEDLAAGRYARKDAGGAGAAARRARFGLYALRLNGTANAAWLETLKAREGAGTLAAWQLGSASESCSDCTGEAAKGFRPLYTFTRVPGSGETRCMVRCKCRLTTQAGAVSFAAGGGV